MSRLYTDEFAEAAEEFGEAAAKFLGAVGKSGENRGNEVSYAPSVGWPKCGVVTVRDNDGVLLRVKANRRVTSEEKAPAQVSL